MRILHPHVSIRVILLLLVFFLGPPTKSFAQAKDWMLKSVLKEENLQYEMPNGFLECEGADRHESRECATGRHTNPLFYSIYAKNYDVIIGFNMLPHYIPSPLLKALVPNLVGPNETHLSYIKSEADTAKYNVVYYTKKYCKKKFNSEFGAEYQLRCNRLFREKYPYCRVVVVHKKDRCNIFLSYYYTDKSEKQVKKCIRKTAGLIKYND